MKDLDGPSAACCRKISLEGWCESAHAEDVQPEVWSQPQDLGRGQKTVRAGRVAACGGTDRGSADSLMLSVRRTGYRRPASGSVLSGGHGCQWLVDKDVAHGSRVSTGTFMDLGAFVVNARRSARLPRREAYSLTTACSGPATPAADAERYLNKWKHYQQPQNEAITRHALLWH